MKNAVVKELMVPLEEYATVHTAATLHEALLTLERIQEQQDRKRYLYLHRAVLVYDDSGRIVGKVSQLDALRALEPKYRDMGEAGSLSRAGFSDGFLRGMLQQYCLWDKPLSDICSRATQIRVKEFMHAPTTGECVDTDAPLEEALHLLVVGRHQSLLVTREGTIVGILRLTDVFRHILERVKACAI